MKKLRIITTVTAVALAAVLLIGGGTFAYLQGESENVVNNFKTNQVNVSISETGDGQYNIVPGTSEYKDPKVTVNNTVDAYVFVEVTDTTEGLVDYEIAEGWQRLTGYKNIYYRIVNGDAEQKDFNILKGNRVAYDAGLKNSDMLKDGQLKENIELSFRAYAVQKEGFDTAEKAWNHIPVLDGTQEELTQAIENGGNIKLEDNVSISPEGTGEDMIAQIDVKKDTNIDLNGKNLSVDTSVKDEELSYTPVILAISGGTTVLDGEGSINAEAGYNNSFGINVNGGTLIINDGSYYGSMTAVQVQKGNLIINGGFFDLAETIKEAAPDFVKYLINCIDENYKNGTAQIEIKGGTFVNFDPSNNPEGTGTSYVADGYKVVSEVQDSGEIWYRVVPETK